jgi:hypothetical protein
MNVIFSGGQKTRVLARNTGETGCGAVDEYGSFVSLTSLVMTREKLPDNGLPALMVPFS